MYARSLAQSNFVCSISCLGLVVVYRLPALSYLVVYYVAVGSWFVWLIFVRLGLPLAAVADLRFQSFMQIP